MIPSNLSINYQSSAPTTKSSILLPHGLSEPLAAGNKEKLKEEGVVIIPTPSIVIKSRLLKSNGSAQPTVLNISGDDDLADSNDTETKVFLNICMHELISLPTKRKTIDEETGKEVDGWHLPMSMGELRPCFDKSGNPAIVADCVLNPRVVNDMHGDSNHFHFVADLVIQCATRKFSKPCFGGLELDKRYKVPKMKYAGYVDDKSGLPFDARMTKLNTDFKPSVAKQRVKGSGKSKPMIEEVESTSLVQQVQTTKSVGVPKQEQRWLPSVRIELFVQCENDKTFPLQEFLDQIANNVPTGALRRHISSPELKPKTVNDSRNLHPSQLLIVPLPYSSSMGLNASNVVARCADTTPDMKVEASAFQLVLSSNNHSKTECVLPFPIDSSRTCCVVKCAFEVSTKTLEIKMPLLQSTLTAEDGADPGTKQWGLANAFSGRAKVDEECNDCDVSDHGESITNYIDTSDTESVKAAQELPEDMFHSQDALSMHYLQQQEEEKKSKWNSHEQMLAGRDGDDTDVIDINDFKPGGKYFVMPERSGDDIASNDTLKKAEDVLKQSMGIDGGLQSMDLAYRLV